jgi:hypothetical protein
MLSCDGALGRPRTDTGSGPLRKIIEFIVAGNLRIGPGDGLGNKSRYRCVRDIECSAARHRRDT